MKINTLIISFLSATFGFSQVPNYVPTANLISWLSSDGNTQELSSNSIDASNFGAILTVDRFGNLNSAYQFSDSNHLDINLNFDASQRSISVWLNPS